MVRAFTFGRHSDSLVAQGKIDLLTSSRIAKEFGVPPASVRTRST